MHKGFTLPTFTDEQIIEYNKTIESVSLIVDASAGGTLSVSVSTDNGWIVVDTFTSTIGEEYFVKGRTLKFTPVGGITYDIPVRE